MFQGNNFLNYTTVDHLGGDSRTLSKVESQSAMRIPFPGATNKVQMWDLDGFWLSDGLAPDTPPPSLHSSWLSRHKGAVFQVPETERMSTPTWVQE